MEEAIKAVREIKRMQEAIAKTTSKKLARDYLKAISRKKKMLKEYCWHMGINYAEVWKGEKGENQVR